MGLYTHRRWLEACNIRYKKKRDCIIYVAIIRLEISVLGSKGGTYYLCSEKKVLISCAVTSQLICTFVVDIYQNVNEYQ